MTVRIQPSILSIVLFLALLGGARLDPGFAQVAQFRINEDPCHSPKGPGDDYGASVGYIPWTGGFQSITQDSFVFVWACARCAVNPAPGGENEDCGSACEIPAIGNPYLRRWNQHLGFLDEKEVLLNSPNVGTATNFVPSCAVQRGGDRKVKIVWSHDEHCAPSVPYNWAELDPFPFPFGFLSFSDFSPRIRAGGLGDGNAWSATTAFSDEKWVAVWTEFDRGMARLMYKIPGVEIGFPPVGIGTGAKVLSTDRITRHSRPCVAAAANDRFVAVWSQTGFPAPYGIRAQRIGEGSTIRVASSRAFSNPAVATFADASFVVVWIEQDENLARTVKMARFSASSPPSALDRAPIQVNHIPEDGLGEDRITVVATGSGVDDPEGRIVVIWPTFSQSLQFRTYSAGAAPLHDAADLVEPGLPGGESSGGEHLGHPGMHPAVLREDGTLVVAWQKRTLEDRNLYSTVRTIP